ncbi:aldo-keto reductase family 1 member C15-like [Gastrophryne carolinensis]
MSVEPYVPLSDGHKIPILGFGTFAPEKYTKSMAEEATKVAIEVGYRHIDCALIYGNEVEVGRAIQEKISDGTVKREDLFCTGKLWSTFHDPEMVRPALERSLKDLQMDFLDLYLIHVPVGLKPGEDLLPVDENGKYLYGNTDLRDTWKAMERCKDAGLVKSIGVSNFNRRQLEMILNMPGLKYKPVCNQVECHLFLNQSKLLEFCRSHNIVLVGYSTLGSSRDESWGLNVKLPVLLEDPVLRNIAERLGRTPAQVAIRYLLQRGIVALAKSFTSARIKQNLEVFDFEIQAEEMKSLDALNKNQRYDSLAITMALTPDSYVVLNDGHKMPVLGFGTYAPETYTKEQAGEATKVAIEAGYRHIDCAFIYGNEVQVGQAINAKVADGTVKREDIFYTGKLWSNNHAPERVRQALEKSLKDLQLDYMDLFLIHSPVEFQPGDNPFPTDENGKTIFHNTDIRETWKAMEACKDAGLVRSIGVSNFNSKQLELILSMPGLKYKPVCNQVECHIFLNQAKLLEFCKSKDIVLVGYSVLGSSRVEQWIDQNSPKVLEDPVLNEIAKKLGRNPAQVAMRYLLQRGIVVLAKSFTAERIRQNFQVFDFELSAEDMKSLDGVNKNMRYLSIDDWKASPKYPYNEEY